MRCAQIYNVQVLLLPTGVLTKWKWKFGNISQQCNLQCPATSAAGALEDWIRVVGIEPRPGSARSNSVALLWLGAPRSGPRATVSGARESVSEPQTTRVPICKTRIFISSQTIALVQTRETEDSGLHNLNVAKHACTHVSMAKTKSRTATRLCIICQFRNQAEPQAVHVRGVLQHDEPIRQARGNASWIHRSRHAGLPASNSA